jgi:phosphate starvation-inducible PhoH-like protein
VVIPPEVQMVTLLGPRDELLRTMERAFPLVSIHVRGNEFHMTGPSADVALVERTIDELLLVIEGGQPLNRDAVERSIGMLRAQTAERPADVLTMNIVSSRGRTIRPKTLNQKHYVDAIDEHASCPAPSTRRSTPTCGRSTTRCTTWSTPTRSRA